MNTISNDELNRSATETAVDKAQEVAGQAQQKISETAAVAKEQAKRTAAEVQERAKTTVDSRMTEVASELGSVAGAVRSTSYDLQGQDQLRFAEVGNRIADQIDHVSEYLTEHSVEDVLSDAESLARRQPALFLGGAFMLGLMAGRFLRSSGQRGIPDYGNGGNNGGSGYEGRRYEDTTYRSGYGSRPAVEYGAETGAGQPTYQRGPSLFNTSNQPEFGEDPTAYPTGLAEE